MEEQWIVDRSRLREVWLEHPDWSKRTLAEAMDRSKAWVKKWLQRIRDHPLGDIGIHELHNYEVRLQWLSERSWLGIVSVDGTERYRMELPPFGPVELQIWSDGYWLSTSPWWKLHTPRLGLQNGEKSFRFDAVEVRSEYHP